MRIRGYIGGPMSNLPLNNVPAFYYAAWRLASENYEPVLPPGAFGQVGCQPGSSALYRRVLPADAAGLARCHVVVALPGWADSRGFMWELHGAELFDIPMFEGESGMQYPDKQHHLEVWMDNVIAALNEWRYDFIKRQDVPSRAH